MDLMWTTRKDWNGVCPLAVQPFWLRNEQAPVPSPLQPAPPPFHCPFWLGGFEGADHLNRQGEPLDMVRSTGHLDLLDEDYARAAAHGIGGVRESIGWRLAEPAPGRFDLARAVRMAERARHHGLQVLWTLMHYGTPPDLSLLDDALIDRFAQFAGEVARTLAPLHDQPPVYNLVNEIGFLSWVVSESNQIHPYRGDPAQCGESTQASGYEVKRRLVRAVLAGIRAVRQADPRARFLHVEPVVHVVEPPGRPDLAPLAERVAGYQWQVWDLIAGRVEPALGGAPEALDLIGVNHYHSGQWEVATERRLHWHERDPRRRPLAALLQAVWARYRRPMLLAETSHFGIGRAAWLHEVAAEVRHARRAGVPVHGVCLYPLIDRHDWDDATHWHHSGMWDVTRDVAKPAAGAVPRGAPEPHRADPRPDPRPGGEAPALQRRLRADYAASLAAWQGHLPAEMNQGTPMPTLIVFSHLRWNFVWQRPQHLMSRLARHYRVLFVEEPVRSGGRPRLDCIAHGPSLEVLVPHTPVDAPGFHDEQLTALEPLLAAHLRAHGIDDYLVWFYTPMALPLIASLQPRAIIYDCMDELSAFKDAPRQLRQRESALMKSAGLVLTGGPSLYAARQDAHPNVHCVPSAVDAAHFGAAAQADDSEEARAADAMQAAIGGPRLGFFGVIDERFDAALLADLAARRPDWQFVMVGPVVKIDATRLPRAANIHWLGMQAYSRLPRLLAGWQVCLMPFALNEATRFISPTKTLEYLAGGKPVVSSAVHDVEVLYSDVVRIARSPGEWVEAIDQVLKESPAARAARLRATQEAVERCSWERSAARVQALIDALLARAAAPAQALQHAGSAPAGAGAPGPATPAAPVAPLAPASNRTPRSVRHLIIGAGPTGLAAALQLGDTSDRGEVLLVEREATVGGWCRSVQQDGFTWDHAGHIMFSNDADVLALYDRLLGDNLHWQNREAWVYSKGVHTRYPFQGALHGLPPAVLKECIVGAIEARFGPLKSDGPPHTHKPAANFEEFIHRVWGAGIAKHFAVPYNQKLWAVPLSEMETSWLGGRVPLPDLEQMIEGALQPVPAPMGPNARFGYPLRGGFQALMDGFLPLLQCELALKTAVLRISPSQRNVRLDDGRSLRFDSLVSTMPLPRLVEACGDEAPPDVQSAAKALRQVSVRCVNLGIALPPGVDRLTDKHWIYYPEDTVFHRIFVQGNASPHCNAPGGFALTCEITYGPAKPLPADGSALIERVVADCRRVGLFTPDHAVLSAHQVDMPGAYVVYDHARAENVARIREWVGRFGIVLAGRYSEWEYYNSDHAFIAGRRAAKAAAAAVAQGRLAQAG